MPRGELGIALEQPASVNDDATPRLIAAAAPDAVCVCAFGALITEPLLSALRDAERPPIAAAALARSGAGRARDHGRRRADRRLDHATHGRAGQRTRVRPGDRADPLRGHVRDAGRPARGARGDLLVRTLDTEPAVRRAGRGRRHLRGENRATPTGSSIRADPRSSSSASCGRSRPTSAPTWSSRTRRAWA